MYFGHRTTNTVTNRVQIDYLKYVLRAFMLTVYACSICACQSASLQSAFVAVLIGIAFTVTRDQALLLLFFVASLLLWLEREKKMRLST